jgi:hypothetical protein
MFIPLPHDFYCPSVYHEGTEPAMRKITFYSFTPKDGDRRLRQLHQCFCQEFPYLTEVGLPLFLPLKAIEGQTPQPEAPLILDRWVEKLGLLFLGTDQNSPWQLRLPGIPWAKASEKAKSFIIKETLRFTQGFIDLVEMEYSPPLGEGFLRWRVLSRNPWKLIPPQNSIFSE